MARKLHKKSGTSTVSMMSFLAYGWHRKLQAVTCRAAQGNDALLAGAHLANRDHR